MRNHTTIRLLGNLIGMGSLVALAVAFLLESLFALLLWMTTAPFVASAGFTLSVVGRERRPSLLGVLWATIGMGLWLVMIAGYLTS